jgi:DNA-binding GntR family transcriptional regulator
MSSLTAAPRPTTAQPGTGGSLAAAAFETLRRAIIRCELEPGSQVTGPQLAERYGLGPSAVREALNRLEQGKLVQAVRRSGYIVAPVTLKDVRDIFQLRIIAECAAARLAAGNVDLVALRGAAERGGKPYRMDDSEAAAVCIQANVDFHLIIARGTGNERLVSHVANLHDETMRLFHLGHRLRQADLEVYDDHDELLAAFEAADPDWAERAMRVQIQDSQQWVLEVLIGGMSIQAINVTG